VYATAETIAISREGGHLAAFTQASGMTASERSSEQLPEDVTALLTAALNHSWAWYEVRSSRAFQVINYYLVASAIVLTAYTSALKANDFGIAAAVALAGLGLTAIAAAGALNEQNAAAVAVPVLEELQDRIAGRLTIDPIRMAASRSSRKRSLGIVVFGLAALFNISALVYAVTR
jgi:hypothetical protein